MHYFFEISGARGKQTYKKGMSFLPSWEKASALAQKEEEKMIALGYKPKVYKVGHTTSDGDQEIDNHIIY